MTDPALDRNGEASAPRSGAEAEAELARLAGKLCDILRYAPIGILLDGPALLPQLAEQGKVHVKNAEWLGGMALKRGRAALGRQLETVGVQAVDFLRMMGVLGDETVERPERPSQGPRADRRPSATGVADQGGGVSGPNGAEAAGAAPTGPAAPPVDDLAIPDYDSLSASQVVNRLDGLSPEELEAVRAYEAAHRGRKTILNKVVQLQA